jgi:hypothetical protein
MLRKLLPPTGIAAQFEDESLGLGHIHLPGRHLVCAFNWSTEAQTLPVLRGVDYWSGQPSNSNLTLPPHSARLIVMSPQA